jgi:hypothetical protein
MRSIHDRPIEVMDRQQPGHWEGDLIIGTKNQSAIGTLVERTSRHALLVHLHDDKSADSVTTGIIKALRGLPEHMRLSLTWDRGMEMAEHARISTALHTPVFFCDPASPWQRGTDENTNGLLRQYLPKGHRPLRSRPGGSAPHSKSPQQPTPKIPRWANPNRGFRCAICHHRCPALQRPLETACRYWPSFRSSSTPYRQESVVFASPVDFMTFCPDRNSAGTELIWVFTWPVQSLPFRLELNTENGVNPCSRS